MINGQVLTQARCLCYVLPADAGRVIDEKVARAADRVIGIGDLSGGGALRADVFAVQVMVRIAGRMVSAAEIAVVAAVEDRMMAVAIAMMSTAVAAGRASARAAAAGPIRAR